MNEQKRIFIHRREETLWFMKKLTLKESAREIFVGQGTRRQVSQKLQSRLEWLWEASINTTNQNQAIFFSRCVY